MNTLPNINCASKYSVEYDNADPFPLSAAPIPKRRFMPSKHERIKINKIVQAIKLGRIDPAKYLVDLDAPREENDDLI